MQSIPSSWGNIFLFRDRWCGVIHDRVEARWCRAKKQCYKEKRAANERNSYFWYLCRCRCGNGSCGNWGSLLLLHVIPGIFFFHTKKYINRQEYFMTPQCFVMWHLCNSQCSHDCSYSNSVYSQFPLLRGWLLSTLDREKRRQTLPPREKFHSLGGGLEMKHTNISRFLQWY